MFEENRFLEPLLDRLQGSANIRTIYGDPIVMEGKTVIPVGRVAYGFGGGACRPVIPSEETGMGGGGGISSVPLGVVEITGQSTRFISFAQRRKTVAALLLGVAIGVVIGRRSTAAISKGGASALSASL